MKKIIIIICALLLSVSVTYAWILESEQNEDYYHIYLDYYGASNKLRVSSLEGITVEVYLYNNNGECASTPISSSDQISFEGMCPGDTLRFKMRFYNDADEMDVCLSMKGITTHGNPEITDYIYFSSWSGEGFLDEGTPISEDIPEWQMNSLSDMMGSGRNAVIYNHLIIPKTSDTGIPFVDLECQFRFDTEGDSPSDAAFNIDCFTLSK